MRLPPVRCTCCCCCRRRQGLLTWMALLLLLPEVKGNCLASKIPFYVTFGGKELNDSYPIGTTLRFRCIPSYTATTALTIQCRNDSTWSETCQRKKCKPPVIENGDIKGNLSFGDEVSFTCNEGYILLGKDTSRCILDDKNIIGWSPAPPHCERIACERPPTIVNGSYGGDPDDHYTVGIVVIYTCNKDFSLIGKSSLECIVAEDGRYGKWNRDPPQCKVVVCDRPMIENGRLTSGFQVSYKYDHELQYICDAGYTVLKSELTRCIANSTWHPNPKCVKVPATTAVPVHPGGNTTSGTTQRPGLTTSTTETGTTQHPGLTTSTTDTGSNSATIAVGKLSLIVALLILTM